MITIRSAGAEDLAEMQAIYAHHVLHGTGSFEEIPPSIEEFAQRFATLTEDGAIWLVATDATGVRGYAYAARYHTRSAYRFTVEDSVYVRLDQHGQGIGAALLGQLIARATARGFRQMLAVIGDSDNAASIALHRAQGFREVGRLDAVGRKFGRWLDVVLMQRGLGPGESTAP